MPSLARRKSMSALRSPLKSATATSVKSTPTPPSRLIAMNSKPFIRYCEIIPSVRRNKRSLRPSPLKSPSFEAKAHVGPGEGAPPGAGPVSPSYLALAGRVYVFPVAGSTHGHGLFPKNAGFDVRYIEFAIV